jgi:hypothetical protein
MANTDCPACGAPLRDGAKFCPRCGAGVRAGVPCPQCGHAVGAGETFCAECGQAAAVSQAAVGPVLSPVAPPQANARAAAGAAGKKPRIALAAKIVARIALPLRLLSFLILFLMLAGIAVDNGAYSHSYEFFVNNPRIRFLDRIYGIIQFSIPMYIGVALGLKAYGSRWTGTLTAGVALSAAAVVLGCLRYGFVEWKFGSRAMGAETVLSLASLLLPPLVLGILAWRRRRLGAKGARDWTAAVFIALAALYSASGLLLHFGTTVWGRTYLLLLLVYGIGILAWRRRRLGAEGTRDWAAVLAAVYLPVGLFLCCFSYVFYYDPATEALGLSSSLLSCAPAMCIGISCGVEVGRRRRARYGTWRGTR